MVIINGADPLDAIPAIREYECPNCGDSLTHQAVQQGTIPLSVDGTEQGAGRYAIYACENNANYGRERNEKPEDKCYAQVTVYESGFVSFDGDVEDRTDTLEAYIRDEGDDGIEDLYDMLRI